MFNIGKGDIHVLTHCALKISLNRALADCQAHRPKETDTKVLKVDFLYRSASWRACSQLVAFELAK